MQPRSESSATLKPSIVSALIGRVGPGHEADYYASIEVIRAPEPRDRLAKTTRFRRSDDPVTSKFVRAEEDCTHRFVRESAPYELIDIHEASRAFVPVPVTVVDADPLAGDTLEMFELELEDAPRTSLRLVLVLGLFLASAFGLGVGVAFLVA